MSMFQRLVFVADRSEFGRGFRITLPLRVPLSALFGLLQKFLFLQGCGAPGDHSTILDLVSSKESMPRRTIHAFYNKINDKFTTFSLSVATFVEARSLLNVPEKQWKLFSALAYIHIALSICLCVLGIICFCFGMVHSVLYTEVSCSNGVNLFMPFLNVVSSFAGLIALRALHMNWPPFIHVITLFLAIWSLSMITVVSCVEANDWYSQSVGTPEPIPAGVKFTNWARIFADMDVIITTMAILNLIVDCIELAIYVKYWLLRPNGS